MTGRSGWTIPEAPLKEKMQTAYPITVDYIAGFFDGEGTIGLYRTTGSANKRYKSGRASPGWSRKVAITNTFRDVLDSIQNVYGGHVTLQKRATDKHKAIWVWHIGSVAGMRAFLHSIEERLFEKREQALVMLAALDGELDTYEAASILKTLKRG